MVRRVLFVVKPGGDKVDTPARVLDHCTNLPAQHSPIRVVVRVVVGVHGGSRVVPVWWYGRARNYQALRTWLQLAGF
jgi:hypothetical protein